MANDRKRPDDLTGEPEGGRQSDTSEDRFGGGAVEDIRGIADDEDEDEDFDEAETLDEEDDESI